MIRVIQENIEKLKEICSVHSVIENIDNIVQHWLDSAKQNHTTMQHMIESKDYNWALFMGHLVIEKTLKAIYVKTLALLSSRCIGLFTSNCTFN